MVSRALKIAAPTVIALGLLVRTMTGAFASETVGISNVAGAAGDCAYATGNGVCATLFTGARNMWPGKAPEQATVTIGYKGTTTHAFGVYLTRFQSRSPRSGALCQAADPALKMNLVISQGSEVIYSGSLSAFGAAHGDSTTMLELRGGHDGSGESGRWADGDSSNFTISVGLDESADNDYMGCVTTTDIAWLAQ